MNKSFETLPAYICRRLDFLLQEAKNNSPRDQIITFCMRVLSNYATIGADASSNKIKMLNRTVSAEAHSLLIRSESFDGWASACVNEHQTPLRVIWEWLLDGAHRLKSEDVWERFCQSKMVTITKREDMTLNAKGLRATGVDGRRYGAANIQIVVLDEDPILLFRSLSERRKG